MSLFHLFRSSSRTRPDDTTMEKLKFITKFPYLIEFLPAKFTGILHLKVISIYCFKMRLF